MTDRTTVHPTADVSPEARLGGGTSVWHQAQVREGAVLGRRCVVGKGVYIDTQVVIGDDCRIQNYACVYGVAELANGVFLGPHVILMNDVYPRALFPDGSVRRGEGWTRGTIRIGAGASDWCGGNHTFQRRHRRLGACWSGCRRRHRCSRTCDLCWSSCETAWLGVPVWAACRPAGGNLQCL